MFGRRFGRTDDPVGTGRPFLLALFGVFVVVMLAALLLGLQGYRAIADDRNAMDERRLAYGSLVNTVKAFDALDAFTVEEFEGNHALNMVQRTAAGTYLMRLYVHDGLLMQQYSLPDVPIAPEDAHALFQTDTFRVEYADGLLTLVTDDVRPCVHLACSQPSLAAALGDGTSASSEAGDV